MEDDPYPLRKWVLNCGHSIVCKCMHWTGQTVYCTRCNLWGYVKTWSAYVPDNSTARNN